MASVEKAPTGTTRGYRPGKSTKMSSPRTPTSTVYENPDGTETTAISSGPVRYQDDEGTWRDIDPKLRARGGRGLAVRGRRHRHRRRRR